MAYHDEAVSSLVSSFRGGDGPVRLAKRTSNLFRTRRPAAGSGLDVAAFDRVLHVDPVMLTAEVEGMTTYENLVAATLRHGLMPLVVPQLRTITVGGAVTGIGIESSSFRSGLVHESVREMEILTGDGDLVVAAPDNDNADLYYGFPNSYGSLGYALRLQIDLEPVQPYVELRHLRFTDHAALFAAMGEICDAGAWFGAPVDFVDGVVFDRDDLVLTLGRFVDGAPYRSDYTGMQVYYRSLQRRTLDYLDTSAYLWRWDTDWFWCSKTFRVQNPWIRSLVPPPLLRSSNYWKLLAVVQRSGLDRRLDSLAGRGEREMIVQDVEVPVERSGEFLDFFHREIGILPVWICPTRQRDPGVTWSLYSMDPDVLYVNFGFWSSQMLGPGEAQGTYNRKIEAKVAELGGRKSLYSTAYYRPDEFWRTYGGDAYHDLKDRYDAKSRLLDLYQKTVERK
ncbi:MAG: FAD-binding oxidoreductase [Acidimicrobiia bacterium]|nr:FAD-binding oxidoreductase [Acidimicrobiia bacterium]